MSEFADGTMKFVVTQSLVVLPGTVTAFSGTFKDGYPVNKNTGLVNREWHLCDGTNGTPDLRNRFIYGGDGTNNGATGGETSHKLTEAEIPPLNFRFDYGKRDTEGKYPIGSQINCAYYGTVTTNTRGGGQSHNNMPPYYVMAYIMKL